MVFCLLSSIVSYYVNRRVWVRLSLYLEGFGVPEMTPLGGQHDIVVIHFGRFLVKKELNELDSLCYGERKGRREEEVGMRGQEYL